MARFVGPCLLVLLLACTRENPGFDEPTASSTSATAAASTGEPTTTGSGTTSDPVTQGSSDTGGTVGLTDSGTDTTEALASTDPTTGAPDTSTTSTTSGSESSSTGEPEPPPPEHLQLYDPGRCGQPLWCHAQGDVNNGSPARTSSQACFTPKMSPPYRVVRVGYRIAARFGDLSSDSKMQIFERTAQGPGALVKELAIGDPDLGVGPHAVVFDGVEIDSPGFCVGLVGGRPVPGAGLGVAVDTEVLGPGQAYIRAEGSAGCAIPQWKDVDSFDPPTTPDGAWCLDADVEAVP